MNELCPDGGNSLVWVVSSKEMEDSKYFVGSKNLVYSFSEWTLLEWKLFCVIVSIVTSSDKSSEYSSGQTDSLRVSIPLKKLAATLRLGNTNAAKQITGAVQGLRGKKISRLGLNNGDENVIGFEQDFFTVAYVDSDREILQYQGAGKERERFVNIELNEMLRPYIFELRESFIKEGMDVMLDFDSVHSLKMYLVFSLVFRQEGGGVSIRTYPLSTLKQFLGLRVNDYVRFCDLQKRVLDPAVNELKSKGLLDVSYKANRAGDGRRASVSTVSFKIEKTPDGISSEPRKLENINPDKIKEEARNVFLLENDSKLMASFYKRGIKKKFLVSMAKKYGYDALCAASGILGNSFYGRDVFVALDEICSQVVASSSAGEGAMS